MRLQAQGMGLEQYLMMTGRSQEQLVDELRESAEISARVDLALRAVVVAEGIECTDDELDAEIDGRRRAGRARSRRRFASSWNGMTNCLRYAPTSTSARRWSGCSTTSRSSTSTAIRSTAASTSTTTTTTTTITTPKRTANESTSRSLSTAV